MSCIIAPTFDQQGNIMPQSQSQPHRPLGMKKSSSVVFSWPAFANNTRAEDVMAPIKNLVQVKSTDTIRSVLWTLIKNKVECVPVFNDSTRKYVGFVDMFDLVQYIANAAGSGVTRSDFFQLFKRQQFADAPISKITSAASKDHCNSVTEFSPITAMFDLCVSANLPQVPVMHKQKVVSMVSQARLAECLFQNTMNFKQLAYKTISQLHFSGTDNVYTIEENTPLVSAFVYMAEKGVKGLAVVNAEGQFVDAVNSFDIKGLVHGDFFSDLRQPVLRYLSKSRILLNKNLSPVYCTQDESLADLLRKMAQERVYRVFVLDAERKPVSVISLRDILKTLHSFVPEVEEQLSSSLSSISISVGGGGQ